jgi:hypothetical protein
MNILLRIVKKQAYCNTNLFRCLNSTKGTT